VLVSATGSMASANPSVGRASAAARIDSVQLANREFEGQTVLTVGGGFTSTNHRRGFAHMSTPG
jgi:hypothetical protein